MIINNHTNIADYAPLLYLGSQMVFLLRIKVGLLKTEFNLEF